MRPGRSSAGRLVASIAVAVLGEVQAQIGCPGGQGVQRAGNDSFPNGACENCPAGRQSPAGEALCLYCRESLKPTAAQDGCECAPLYFSPWSGTQQQSDVACTPCSALRVYTIADNTPRSLLDKVASEAESEPSSGYDTYAVSCTGPSVGVHQLRRSLGHAQADVVTTLCDEYDDTECAGGAKGVAEVCPNEGRWILPQPFEQIRRNVSALPPVQVSDQAGLFTVQECVPPRGGGASRCQHWSRCVQEADTEEHADDPWAPYVSDKEFAAWLAKGENVAQNCRTVLSNIRSPTDADGRPTPIEDFDDPWDRVRSDGLNCCAPDFMGHMCETCIEPLMKINEQCVACEGAGFMSIDWKKIAIGIILSVAFTVFAMHKATMTFGEADGTTSIAIFFFQIVALLFKDRAARFSRPFVVSLLEFLELSFLANSRSTCTVKLDFYPNYYFDILSTLVTVLISFSVMIIATSLTSRIVSVGEKGPNSAKRARHVAVAEHVLAHLHLFKSLSPDSRRAIAESMDIRDGLKRCVTIQDEGDDELFIIVVKGKIHIDAADRRVSTIKAGGHFGLETLYHTRVAPCTVTSATEDTAISIFTRMAFVRSTAQLTDEERQSMDRDLHDAHHEEEHGELVGLGDTKPTDEVPNLLNENESVQDKTQDKMSEVGEAAKVLILQLNQSRQRVELTTEVEIHSCCAGLVEKGRLVGQMIGRLYAASLDPTARAAAMLEVMIAFYGPLTLKAMSLLFCRDILHVTADGVSETRSVLVVDSARECTGSDYDKARMFGICWLAIFVVGVPTVMLYAAKVFDMKVSDSYMLNHEAKEMAKSRFHSSWKKMEKKERKRVIEQCAHDIRLQVMGQSSFMLSSFQMCVERRHAYWYPQWHLVRRTVLNYLYFDGLRSGDNTTGVFIVANYDWRVVVAMVLIVSNVLQQYTQPFRDQKEDNLETWSLNILTLIVVIDIADENKSIYACIVVCVFFCLMVVHQLWEDYGEKETADEQWKNLRKLQHTRGRVQNSGTASMLKIELAKGDERERFELLKQTFKNPLDLDEDDAPHSLAAVSKHVRSANALFSAKDKSEGSDQHSPEAEPFGAGGSKAIDDASTAGNGPLNME